MPPFILFDADPPGIDTSVFPCFSCGTSLAHLRGSIERYCARCEVWEMRLTAPYFPLARTVVSVPCGEWKGLPYLDHSLGHYPSPA